MKTHYRHLSSEERALIMIKVRQGKSCRVIARLLDRSPSTISRELARNSATASTPEQQPSRYDASAAARSEEHTSELQSRGHLVCRLLLEKKKNKKVSNIFSRTKCISLPL